MSHQAKIIQESVQVAQGGVSFIVVCCAGSTNEKQFSANIEKMHKLTPQERIRRVNDIVAEVAEEHAAEHAAALSVSELFTEGGLLVKMADCCAGGRPAIEEQVDDAPVAVAMPADDPAPVVDPAPVPAPAPDPTPVTTVTNEPGT